MRNLSFNLEPVVLRDQGFAPAVRALTDQIGLAHDVQVEVDVEAAEQLADKTQAAMYQIIREALDQAVRRGPPTTLSVSDARRRPTGASRRRSRTTRPASAAVAASKNWRSGRGR